MKTTGSHGGLEGVLGPVSRALPAARLRIPLAGRARGALRRLLRRAGGGPVARTRTPASGDPARYFLPADYRSNPARSFAADGGYWTPERIAASHHFQYYAYRRAWELWRSAGFDSVLDVGSGPGVKLGAFFARDARRIAMLDQPGTEAAARRVLPTAHFVAADLEAPPALDERFDLVLCMDVIEHLGDPDPLTAWLREHVNERGRLVLSTPDRDVRRGPPCRDSPNPLHVREWSAPELRAYLEDRGFEVLEQRNLPMLRPPAWLYALCAPLNRLAPAPRWGACQLVVARPRGRAG